MNWRRAPHTHKVLARYHAAIAPSPVLGVDDVVQDHFNIPMTRSKLQCLKVTAEDRPWLNDEVRFFHVSF